MIETSKVLFSKLKSAQRIFLVTHTNPDGDALGSISAMMEVNYIFGKHFYSYCYDQPPSSYNFLSHFHRISKNIPSDFQSYDLIISLDCGSLARTKLESEIKSRKPNQYFIEIDHHPKMEDVSDLELRMPEASSTTEIIYQILKDNDISLNQPIATAILTGILTDTGNFVYPSTTRQAVIIAAEMLKLGARLPKIIEYTSKNKSLNSMKLWGLAMSRLVINPRYRLAYTALTSEDIISSGVSEDELDGIAGFISHIPEADIVLFLRQTLDGYVKGSLRSVKDNVDVSNLARFFGGGGHHKASGFMVKGKLVFNGNSWQIKNNI